MTDDDLIEAMARAQEACSSDHASVRGVAAALAVAAPEIQRRERERCLAWLRHYALDSGGFYDGIASGAEPPHDTVPTKETT